MARSAGKVSRRIDGPAHPFFLKKGVGDGTDHHVMLPPRIRPALEVVEPEFGLEVLIMLLDRPALVCEPDQGRQGGRGRQRD
jgi:hypothetical protein